MNYLTQEEVIERTGYVHRYKQQMFLAQRSIPFDTDARGRTLVLRSIVEIYNTRKKTTPDWLAMRKAG